MFTLSLRSLYFRPQGLASTKSCFILLALPYILYVLCECFLCHVVNGHAPSASKAVDEASQQFALTFSRTNEHMFDRKLCRARCGASSFIVRCYGKEVQCPHPVTSRPKNKIFHCDDQTINCKTCVKYCTHRLKKMGR